MRTIEISSLIIPESRQRRDNKKSKDLASLKKSILSKGLLHPPVITRQEATELFALVAGERRTLSLKELHEDGLVFHFDGQPVPIGHMPYTLISELDPADLEEAELEENILRMNLTWQEETAAKLKIHQMRLAKNPNQRLIDTAQEIVDVQGNGEAITEKKNLSMAQQVIAQMSVPEVASSKNLSAAYRKVVDRKLAMLNRELLAVTPSASAHKIILGDCRDIMPDLPLGTFDLIISDPPYGIKADKMSQELKHAYDDSPTTALSIYQEILRHGFHLLKPKGTIFLFCDIEHFLTIRTFAEQQAFSTWRTPIIWHKGNEGFAPWGKNGFIRTYETILFCIKGQNDLVLNGGPDVRTIKRVDRDSKSHAAEKPPELLRWLLEISCRREASVLDPCCGTAPIIPAAAGLGLEITGIESNETTYEKALLRLNEEETIPESIVSRAQTLQDIEERILRRNQPQ